MHLDPQRSELLVWQVEMGGPDGVRSSHRERVNGEAASDIVLAGPLSELMQLGRTQKRGIRTLIEAALEDVVLFWEMLFGFALCH